MSDLFEIVGVKPELAEQQVPEKENRWYDSMVVCHHSDTDRGWLSVLQSNHDKRPVLHGSEKLYNCSM